jgi:hypothetical protein
MSLVGRANWWLPGWLDRILPHLDLELAPVVDDAVIDLEPERELVDAESTIERSVRGGCCRSDSGRPAFASRGRSVPPLGGGYGRHLPKAGFVDGTGRYCRRGSRADESRARPCGDDPDQPQRVGLKDRIDRPRRPSAEGVHGEG